MPDDIAPFNPLDTVLSQYKSSPTIVQLVENLDQQINPAANFQMFYDYVWNISTAQGFGQDILGRIVNMPRQISNVPAIYPSTSTPGTVSLTDAQYQIALLVKAWSNISNSSASGINNGLRIFARGRGNAFVQRAGTMKIRYTFYFAPEPYEYAIITTGNIAVRPAGVDFDIQTVNPYFGFSEAMSWQPFDQAPFAAY